MYLKIETAVKNYISGKDKARAFAYLRKMNLFPYAHLDFQIDSFGQIFKMRQQEISDAGTLLVTWDKYKCD